MFSQDGGGVPTIREGERKRSGESEEPQKHRINEVNSQVKFCKKKDSAFHEARGRNERKAQQEKNVYEAQKNLYLMQIPALQP